MVREIYTSQNVVVMFLLLLLLLGLVSGGSPLHLYESEYPTRSPSPAPSSGLESSSFKDSPLQIDMMGADGASLGKYLSVGTGEFLLGFISFI